MSCCDYNLDRIYNSICGTISSSDTTINAPGYSEGHLYTPGSKIVINFNNRDISGKNIPYNTAEMNQQTVKYYANLEKDVKYRKYATYSAADILRQKVIDAEYIKDFNWTILPKIAISDIFSHGISLAPIFVNDIPSALPEYTVDEIYRNEIDEKVELVVNIIDMTNIPNIGTFKPIAFATNIGKANGRDISDPLVGRDIPIYQQISLNKYNNRINYTERYNGGITTNILLTFTIFRAPARDRQQAINNMIISLNQQIAAQLYPRIQEFYYTITIESYIVPITRKINWRFRRHYNEDTTVVILPLSCEMNLLNINAPIPRTTFGITRDNASIFNNEITSGYTIPSLYITALFYTVCSYWVFAHEFLHILGMYHAQQTRRDGNPYTDLSIYINDKPPNVFGVAYEARSFDIVPFSYESIMIYPIYACDLKPEYKALYSNSRRNQVLHSSDILTLQLMYPPIKNTGSSKIINKLISNNNTNSETNIYKVTGITIVIVIIIVIVIVIVIIKKK
jgi:hypothetical protein